MFIIGVGNDFFRFLWNSAVFLCFAHYQPVHVFAEFRTLKVGVFAFLGVHSKGPGAKAVFFGFLGKRAFFRKNAHFGKGGRPCFSFFCKNVFLGKGQRVFFGFRKTLEVGVFQKGLCFDIFGAAKQRGFLGFWTRYAVILPDIYLTALTIRNLSSNRGSNDIQELFL